MFSQIPLKVEEVKRRLLKKEGLLWTDLLALCAIVELQEEIHLVRPIDLIKRLRMNRNWVYGSLRRLQEKELVQIMKRPRGHALISLGGWGRVLLHRAQECFDGNTTYFDEDES